MDDDRAGVDTLREALAELEHERWSDWMAYFLGKCTILPDGSRVIPPAYVGALIRQLSTPYVLLSSEDQDKDRAEADKTLAILGLLGDAK